ncbi:hypothetical protein SFK315_2116 [Shigella flexneri K-315]|uniref:IS1 encoded protein n=4 Tax=Shigella TaxID=620 RepID=I6CPW0_SHIFL|nr:hypothetical protein SFK315_2116 [Shigella flexneri K-315]
MPCFTAMRAEIALMSGSAFAVTHHAFSSGAGRTSDGNGSHASTLKSPSYTKSVSWQHYPRFVVYSLPPASPSAGFFVHKEAPPERGWRVALCAIAWCRVPPGEFSIST